MARYRVNCDNCVVEKVYFFPTEQDTRVIACPNCQRGTMAVKINDKDGTLSEKDGMVGVFKKDEAEHDHQRKPKRRV